jgi:hypothetical protein
MADATGRLVPAEPDKIISVARALAMIPQNLTLKERGKIADRVRLGIARNFTREGPEGMKWRALAMRTREERRELGYPGEHPILQRTRELKRSWTERRHPHHIEEWDEEDGLTLHLSSSDPRVPELTLGRDSPYMPPRPQHLLGDDDLQGLHDTIVWVLEQVADRGL